MDEKVTITMHFLYECYRYFYLCVISIPYIISLPASLQLCFIGYLLQLFGYNVTTTLQLYVTTTT